MRACNSITNSSYSMPKSDCSIPQGIILMKKIFLTLCLLYLAVASHYCEKCIGQPCPNCPTCKCPDNKCCNNLGIDVHKPICPHPPPFTIDPPHICKPCIKPPKCHPPKIDIPCIEVPEHPDKCVIPPPDIHPPRPHLPPPPPPKFCPPKLPYIPEPEIPTPCDFKVDLPDAPVFTDPTPQDDKFELKFEYACRRNVDFLSCRGVVVWNDVVVYSVNPDDYDVTTVSLTVSVQAGENTLQFEGAGPADGLGLTIDNVRLVRDGVDIVVNGGFSHPNVYGSWDLFDDIKGWYGQQIEVGRGSIYNSQWGHSQVVELDGNSNFAITQYYHFDSYLYFKGNDKPKACAGALAQNVLLYKLSLKWSARTKGVSSLATSVGVVVWNDVIVGNLVPSDDDIQHSTFDVVLLPGKNVLHIDGAGNSDSYGLVVDKVSLSSVFDSSNLIKNGDFEHPSVNPHSFQYIDGGIPHWEALRAEVGDCRIYNDEWNSFGHNQCIELDSDGNQRYTQVVKVGVHEYAKLVLKANQVAKTGALISCVQQTAGSAIAKHYFLKHKFEGIIKAKSILLGKVFQEYLSDLYGSLTARTNYAVSNQLVELKKYGCCVDSWIKKYGQCGHSFHCDGYDSKYLQKAKCYIDSIFGSVVNCHYGQRRYKLYLSKCTKFEGEFDYPRIGDIVYWKGILGEHKIKVLVASTCQNC